MSTCVSSCANGTFTSFLQTATGSGSQQPPFTSLVSGDAEPPSGSRIVATLPKRRLELKTAFGDASELFADCKRVRQKAGDQLLRHPFDAFSHQYCLYCSGEPVGTMTATQRVDGELDCEAYYPQVFIQRYFQMTVSYSKFRINDFEYKGPSALTFFGQSVWQDQAAMGMRFDIMNATSSKRSGYESVGYVCIDGLDFVHPVLGTDSRVMILAADGSRRSMFKSLFQSLEDQVSFDAVLEALNLRLRAPEATQS